MRTTNVKRIERAAELLERAAELLEYVTEKDEMRLSDNYYICNRVRDMRQDVGLLRTIAKVEREDKRV